MTVRSRQDALVSDVFKASLGVAGLALCLTLVFLGMRSVMDVGGACADGGPYVSAQPCPDGATPALLLGIFGLFLFGAIGMWFGARVGGIWAATPLLAWSALFVSLGWNFLDYGVFAPPDGAGIVWGWALCGVLFMLMGGLPLLGGLAVFGDAPLQRPRPTAGASRGTFTLQPAADADPEAVATFTRSTASAQARTRVGPALGGRAAELRAIAADMGAVVTEANADTAADPLARPDRRPTRSGEEDPGFSEGTQALLDRLERLADLRDRGLLAPDEYEAAKDAVVHELELRS